MEVEATIGNENDMEPMPNNLNSEEPFTKISQKENENNITNIVDSGFTENNTEVIESVPEISKPDMCTDLGKSAETEQNCSEELSQNNIISDKYTFSSESISSDSVSREITVPLTDPNTVEPQIDNSEQQLENVEDENPKIKILSNVTLTPEQNSESLNEHKDPKQKKHRRVIINDDDSDEENIENLPLSPQNNLLPDDNLSDQEPKSITKNKKALIDSDSENENETPETAPIYNINSRGELIEETNILKSRLQDLCSPDTSEDESNDMSSTNQHNLQNDYEEETIIPKPYKKSSKSNKENKMTARQAQNLRKEIQSESQRRMREADVSLPYHKPKSYGIREFLTKRTRLSSTLPIDSKINPALAIKMSKEKLELIHNKIKEREKEVKEFYKSESEEEEEDEVKEAKEETKAETINSSDLIERHQEEMEVDNEAIVSEENKPVDSTEEIKETEMQEEEPKIANEDGPKDHEEEINAEEQDQNEDNHLQMNEERMEIDNQYSLENFEEETNEKTEESNKEKPEEMNKELDETEEEPKSSLALIKERLSSIQPRLSGAPDTLIDLETGVTKPNEISKLKERFCQEIVKEQHHKHSVKLNITTVTGGKIQKETITTSVDEDEVPIVENPKLRLYKLRDELKEQMAQRRSEQWKNKTVTEISKKADTEEPEKENYEEEAWLDNEDEEDVTESESEEEENDVDLKDKPKSKSAFVDDEAEESIIEDQEQEEDEEDIEKTEETEPEEEKPKRKLKRILQAFTEDSDDEEIPALQFDKKDTSLDTTISADEDYHPPPGQPQQPNRTPQRSAIVSRTDFGFLTPISYITGLQNLNSVSKNQKDSPIDSPLRLADPSPLKDWHPGLQKKLFEESEDLTDSQSVVVNVFKEPENEEKKIEELSEMCSGNFATQSGIETSTQDLADLCSGNFSTADLSEVVSEKVEDVTIRNESDLLSNGNNLDDDQIISQLIDEKELERFKKQFESPVMPQQTRKMIFPEAEEVKETGVIDSDDEEGVTVVKKKKSKQQKITFSDDESEDEVLEADKEEENEESELEDDDKENIGEENAEVDYDSEENEVIVDKAAKPGDFFEDEAELSESEWGSADEDEKDLDDFEVEKGDEEKFDQKKLKHDLERIHMRRMLDDDSHDIKILQEMLLEDGELHGTGRQRQFKWKNIGSFNEDGPPAEGDEEAMDEEEEEVEEEWRKKRHQREMFLMEQNEKSQKYSNDDDADLSLVNSQILKIGQKAIIKSQSLSSAEKSKVVTETRQVKSFSLLSNKRGSFLSRSEQVLQRLAEFSKIGNCNIGATAKNSRNFVFQSVKPGNSADKKRKAQDGTPKVLKKLRLSANLSPAVSKKNAKTEERSKKLF